MLLAVVVTSSAALGANSTTREILTSDQRMALKAEMLDEERAAQMQGFEGDENKDLPFKTTVEITVGQDAASELDVASTLISGNNFTTYKSSHPGASYKLLPRPGKHSAPVSPFGDFVTLNDGSYYQVKKSDTYKVLNWNMYDVIIVLPPYWFSSHDYVMVNTNTGAKVEVKLLEPKNDDPFCGYFAIGVDYDSNRVTLHDGSIWSLSMFDRKKLERWYENDLVTIGINNDWLSTWNPNILINVNTNEYVRAKCVF
jgi:hypothetical protein